MAELLDLDGEVFHAYLQEAAALAASAVPDPGGVRRVADLGCGTGNGTLALAGRFPAADLYPVDASGPLLEHLARRAAAGGVAGRVHPVEADLDQQWPAELHDLDLVWASASVHHLADPVAALGRIRTALAPGGVLALVEIDELTGFQPSFLPADSGGEAGMEERVRAAVLPDMTAVMPYLGADWGQLLADAGFTVTADRTFHLALRPPVPAAAARYALLALRRAREQLRDLGREGDVPPADLVALDELAGDGPGSVVHHAGLQPRARRRLWLARRP